MPRGQFPPTPAPSTDIVGKESVFSTNAEHPLVLPPSAMGSRSSVSSDARAEPLSPRSPGTSSDTHKKPGATQPQASSLEMTLPPPPTRPRKIIQMKPSAQTPVDTGKAGASTGGKKKQAPSTSAGRKIARKTAHSIIERRRRSKMNEEFGVLKDMIPACSGQEMHKLAILSASIEYLRYLEQCVSDLQAGRAQSQFSGPSSRASPEENAASASNGDDSDEEMEEDPPTPVTRQDPHARYAPYGSNSVSASPAFSVSSHRFSIQSSIMDLPPPIQPVEHYSRHGSTSYTNTPLLHSQTSSQNPSPMILPRINTDLDQEASAALLMLNAIDRRLTDETKAAAVDNAPRWRVPSHTDGQIKSASKMRGMSVQDLLRN